MITALSVRELRRNAPKFPADSFRKGAPHTFYGIARTFLRSVGQEIGRAQGDLLYTTRVREAELEIPVLRRSVMRTFALLLVMTGSAMASPIITTNSDTSGTYSVGTTFLAGRSPQRPILSDRFQGLPSISRDGNRAEAR